jgi:hypothetical protein
MLFFARYNILIDIQGTLIDIHGTLIDIQGTLIHIQGTLIDIHGSLIDIQGTLQNTLRKHHTYKIVVGGNKVVGTAVVILAYVNRSYAVSKL